VKDLQERLAMLKAMGFAGDPYTATVSRERLTLSIDDIMAQDNVEQLVALVEAQAEVEKIWRFRDKHLTFTVWGLPYAKGSKTPVKRGDKIVMIDGAFSRSKDRAKRKLHDDARRSWPVDVESAARAALVDSDWLPWDGAVNVAARFWFPRPKTETRAERLRVHYAKKPDLDKLIRAVLDPMKLAGVFTDDCRAVTFEGSFKRYVPWSAAPADPSSPIRKPNGNPRCEIVVTQLEEN
jgi:hypothetical protein